MFSHHGCSCCSSYLLRLGHPKAASRTQLQPTGSPAPFVASPILQLSSVSRTLTLFWCWEITSLSLVCLNIFDHVCLCAAGSERENHQSDWGSFPTCQIPKYEGREISAYRQSPLWPGQVSRHTHAPIHTDRHRSKVIKSCIVSPQFGDPQPVDWSERIWTAPRQRHRYGNKQRVRILQWHHPVWIHQLAVSVFVTATSHIVHLFQSIRLGLGLLGIETVTFFSVRRQCQPLHQQEK